jgi:hypothetical protein
MHAEQHFIFHSVFSSPRYHTGSLAFGSLILASVQMFKVIVEYLDRRLKSKFPGLTVDLRGGENGMGWAHGDLWTNVGQDGQDWSCRDLNVF